MTTVSSYRRTVNRCESVKVEYGGDKATRRRHRSWRCDLVAGHAGRHESRSGHRYWADPEPAGLFDPR
jgi:hypothetical protein